MIKSAGGILYKVYGSCVSQFLACVQTVPRIVPTDPDDDHVLACALTDNAKLIVSGDYDLLSLKTYRDFPIVAAAEAVRIVTAARNSDAD